MKHILFVDDEQRILDGLLRMFRPMRDEWETTFATSGQAALDEMAKSHFDVVVTDMRMPGMDGAELLAEVRTRYPSAVRVVLSGHSDREMILRSVGHAHQYLSKPCDPEELKSIIRRACSLRELMANPSLCSMVASMQTLPVLPSLYAELMAAIASPTSSADTVAAIIMKDLGMTTKVLQLVNSAFFGIRQTITSPAQAVSYLGFDTLKSLVLSVQIFDQFRGLPNAFFTIEALWRHSLTVGSIARAIAGAERRSQAEIDAAYTSGLLHDVGVLVLTTNVPREYDQILNRSHTTPVQLCDAEREALGATHAEVGAYLLGLWGLNDMVVEAVAYHHSPMQCVARAFAPLTAVHVANVLEQEKHAAGTHCVSIQVDTEYLGALGLAERIPVWRELSGASVPNGGRT
jgi:HD-like signal output (HDOD) protein